MKKLTVQAIQEELWEGIQELKTGGRTCQEVQAMTNASDKILKSVALQLTYAKLSGEKPTNIPLLT